MCGLSVNSGSADQVDEFEVSPKATKLYFQYKVVPPQSILSQKFTSLASAFPVNVPCPIKFIKTPARP